MPITLPVVFRIRRDTSVNWAAANPVLDLAEPGLDTTKRRLKFGDAAATWSALPWGTVAYSDALGALEGVVMAADQIPYYTGADTAAATPLTAFGRSLIDDANAAAARATLGLGSGALRPTSNALEALEGVVMAADQIPYYTGASAAAATPLTAFGRSLIDDANAAAGRTTLALGTAATVNTGTTGAVIPLLSTANIWTGTQTIGNGTGSPQFILDGGPGGAAAGAYIRVNQNGSTIGYMGAEAGISGTTTNYVRIHAASNLVLYAGATLTLISNGGNISAQGSLFPSTDNARTLGTAALRWSTVYAATGAINTSDERVKEAIGAIPDAWLDAWGAVEWSRYRFTGGDRWHIGLVAQRVRDAFAALGLDALDIGLLCFDAWDDGDRWGLRYDECFALEAAWTRRELARLRGGG